MPFTVEDFQDLVRLLEERPEWRGELRRLVLTEELLGLPALVQQLGERVDQLTQRMDQLTQRMDQLTQRMDQLTGAVHELTRGLGRAEDRIGILMGEAAEMRYRFRGGAYFAPIARRVRLVDSGRFADLLVDAVEAGVLSAADRDTVLRADLLFSGRRPESGEDVYLLVEVSYGIGAEDVTRALHRARLLAQLGRSVLPVVAGASITDDAAEAAAAAGVWQVLDEQTVRPATAA